MKAGKDGWPRRMEHLRNVQLHSDFDAAETTRQTTGQTLALLRSSRILGLDITPTKSPDWTAEERVKLEQGEQQASLLDDEQHRRPVPLLEKIPHDFHYRYECIVEGKPKVYRHKIVDWEAGALYRRLRKEHGAAGWEAPFRAKYEQDLPSKDLHLLLGTIHRFKNQWLAVSVICPPKPQTEDTSQKLLF